jgi:hypothetical protein
VWGKCDKPKSGKNVEKFGVEKMWINDLEEVKSVEKSVTNFRGKILHI